MCLICSSALVLPIRAEPAKAPATSTGTSKPQVKNSASAAKAVVKLVAGYRIVQVSEYSGQFEIVVASTGLKIKNKRDGMAYLVHAKSDDVTVLNERAKTFCTLPVSKWKPPFTTGSLMRGDAFIDLKVTKTESVKDHGLKAEKKSLKNIHVFSGPAVERADKLSVASALDTVTPELPCEKPAWKVVSALFGLPELGGYPLIESYINRKHTDHADLRIEFLKEEKVPSTELEVPPAFKQVADMKSVYANSADSDSFKDILEGF